MKIYNNPSRLLCEISLSSESLIFFYEYISIEIYILFIHNEGKERKEKTCFIVKNFCKFNKKISSISSHLDLKIKAFSLKKFSQRYNFFNYSIEFWEVCDKSDQLISNHSYHSYHDY